MSKVRKSPEESAIEFPIGTIKKGNDKNKWVITQTASGVKRWSPYTSVELNGYKALTVNYLKKNIGKEIKVYEREYKDTWVKKSEKMFRSTFIPTGNAVSGKNFTVIENWLKTQKPEIKDNTIFGIEGNLKYPGEKINLVSLQVDSKNKSLVSSNIINMEAFIKI
jgi:hypothetical protein